MSRIPQFQTLVYTLVYTGACAQGASAHAAQGAPADVLESIAALSSDHTALFDARELTIPPGHPVLETHGAIRIREAALSGAHAATAQLAELEVLFEELYEDFDTAWPGAGRRSIRTRVACASGGRSAAWEDRGTDFVAAVLKRDDLDLVYHDSGPAVGPQVLAYAPDVGRVAPDLLHHLQPLPTRSVALESLQRYAWSRTDPPGAEVHAWTAVHPAAPERPLELQLDAHSGMPRAVSMPYHVGRERNAVACWMDYRPFEELGDQPWLGRLLAVQAMGGGLAITAIEIESVGFAPTAEALALELPESAHLYDHRAGHDVYYGPRSEWPDEIARDVRRGSAAGVPSVVGQTDAARSPAPPSEVPRRAWGRFMAALVMLSGVMLVLAPAATREVSS